MPGLRQYRKALGEEENRVSYWRRIIQARLDMVDSDGVHDDIETLRPMLTQQRLDGGRDAIISVVPVDDIPPLPNLEALWAQQIPAADRDGRSALIQELRTAETQLSEYRSALHRRLSAATGELIARYREDPTQCLDILPLPPEKGAVLTR